MSELEILKLFIFDDEVQKIFSDINDNLMDFNILEITGMGTQEIKHSNILGWLLEDSEHGLEYRILENFLKKVIEENRVDASDENINNLNKLREYIYLSKEKKEITIYREKDDIDLLIVDETNKVVITIENKVYAKERKKQVETDEDIVKEKDDGGQLQKYENTITNKYNNKYAKYFIYLTIDLEKPSKDGWLRANHQMVTDVIEDILSTKHDIAIKSKIILESYVDILKRRGIVEDIELKKLCKKIWADDKYKNALDILMRHKTSRVKIFYDEVLRNELSFFDDKDFDDNVWIKSEGTSKLFDIEKVPFLACQYFNDSIEIYFSYEELCKSNKAYNSEICTNIIGDRGRTKKYKVRKEYTITDFQKKGDEDRILKEIKETIKEIDNKLMNILQNEKSGK